MSRASALAPSEKAFQEQVLELARLCGWRAYHTFDSRRSAPGFPDLVLVSAHRRQVLWVELKTEKGLPSNAQMDWINDLLMAGADVRVWRPSSWDEIERTLNGRVQVREGGHGPVQRTGDPAETGVETAPRPGPDSDYGRAPAGVVDAGPCPASPEARAGSRMAGPGTTSGRSSMAERLASNQEMTGSTPAARSTDGAEGGQP